MSKVCDFEPLAIVTGEGADAIAVLSLTIAMDVSPGAVVLRVTVPMNLPPTWPESGLMSR